MLASRRLPALFYFARSAKRGKREALYECCFEGKEEARNEESANRFISVALKGKKKYETRKMSEYNFLKSLY